MAWKSVWINPQKEPSFQSWTLVLTSPAGEIHRVDKVFSAAKMSKEEFEAAAAIEIALIEAEVGVIEAPPVIEE